MPLLDWMPIFTCWLMGKSRCPGEGAGQARRVVVETQRRLGMAAIHQEVQRDCTILTTSMAGSSAYSCLPALVKSTSFANIPRLQSQFCHHPTE